MGIWGPAQVLKTGALGGPHMEANIAKTPSQWGKCSPGPLRTGPRSGPQGGAQMAISGDLGGPHMAMDIGETALIHRLELARPLSGWSQIWDPGI